MLTQNQIFYTAFITTIITLIIFLAHVSNILLPFVIGIILAYFLNPVVHKLKTHSCSRGFASFLVVSCFVIITIFFYITLGPILGREFIDLANNLPHSLNSFEKFITPYYERFVSRERPGFLPDSHEIIEKVSAYLLSLSTSVLQNIWQSGIMLINLFSLIFITPIVTFYLLKDWEEGIKHLQRLIPKRQNKSFNKLFHEIDQVLSAYIRGQTTICLVLGIFYAFALTIAGLKHGFFIGFLTGLFSFIPYLGVFIGMSIGVIVAIVQFKSTVMVAIILGIFIFGQFIEGNFITPNLVGDKIGIHPVIIIFTLLAGGSLFGFVGILFAIPFCAVSGVIIKNLISTYNKSKFFRFIPNRKPKVRKSNG